HPNIVQILDFFRHERSFLIALEYVHGRNLRTILADAKTRGVAPPWQACVFIVSEVLKALDYAHKSEGSSGPLHLVHRDVSPQNVLISYAGLIKLSDFGIARADIAREETGSGILKGKCRYLAPEQLQMKRIDFRVDLFAAGVMLYELITGKHPFAAETEFELLKRIERADFEPPSILSPGVPSAVHEAIVRALRLDPGERHKDAAQFRRDLSAALDPAWLSGGSDQLAAWLETLYPDPAEREEPPIEKTPLLSRHGTPLPGELVPTESLILGIFSPGTHVQGRQRPMVRPPFLWAAVVACAISVFLWFLPLGGPSPSGAAGPRPAPPPGSVSVPNIAAPYGTLHINAPKKSRVYANGRRLGIVPLTAVQERIAPGTYLISVKPPKRRSTHKRIRIEAGQTLSLNAPFKEKK
ncbi:MAG: serine/threonine-protein kinase, partial [Pseudomonadota bacterium]